MNAVLAGAVVNAFLYLFQTARAPSLARSLTKTSAVALLAIAAFLTDGPFLLVLALVLCAIGDFCLSREGEGAFMAGVGAFAAGHLAYVGLFLRLEGSDASAILHMPAVFLAIGIVVMGIGMARVLAPRAGDLKLPVLIYIPIILAMGLSALTLPAVDGLVWVLPAALAFMASDVILAFETFVFADDHPARKYTPYAIWPLYWGAQAGFWMAFS